MKTKKEKLKQNNLSSIKNRVANQNNKRNKKIRDWSRKKNTMQKKLFCVAKIYQRSKKFISVAKKLFCVTKILLAWRKKSVE